MHVRSRDAFFAPELCFGEWRVVSGEWGKNPFAIRHFAIRTLLPEPNLRQRTPAVDRRHRHDQALHSHERKERKRKRNAVRSLFRNHRSLAGCGARPRRDAHAFRRSTTALA